MRLEVQAKAKCCRCMLLLHLVLEKGMKLSDVGLAKVSSTGCVGQGPGQQG